MISIIVATYGKDHWRVLAESRAVRSASEQGAKEVIAEHQPLGTLANARNAAARRATGDFLLFLDGDDELGTGYVEAMRDALDSRRALYAPRVQYIRGKKVAPPKYWPEVDLRLGSWLVIGTLIPRELFFEVGGFGEEPIYEDWALFARCWKAGASIVKVPEAVYIAHMQSKSRNHNLRPHKRAEAHYQIGKQLFPDLYNESWLSKHARHLL